MSRSFLYLAIIATLLVSIVSGATSPDKQLMDKLVAQYQNNTKARLSQTGPCTAEKLRVRKEW
jgi:tyrosinase